MRKHSPGPWRLVKEYDRSLVKAKDGFVVFDSEPGAATVSKDLAAQDRANARLIASAPDLLRELKALVERCDGEEGIQPDGSNMDTLAAHAAIRKAEGE